MGLGSGGSFLGYLGGRPVSPKGSHPGLSCELGLVQFSHLDVSDSLDICSAGMNYYPTPTPG